MPSTRLPPEDGPALRFERFARDLGVPLMGERSLKFYPGGLSAERYLLSLPRPALDAAARQKFARIPQQFGLPEAALQRFLAEADTADVLHFGADAETGGTVLKLYCEYAGTLRRDWASARRSGHTIVVHRAVKWLAEGGAPPAFSTYTVAPALAVPETARRIVERLGAGPAGELALGLLHRAAGRVGAEARLFLEVEEEGSDRRSFDLKLYDAGFTLGPLAEQLSRLAVAFHLAPEARDRLAALPPDMVLGHLSGGQGRDGLPFLTLYLGGGPA